MSVSIEGLPQTIAAQPARVEQRRQAAVVRMRLPRNSRVVVQLVANQVAEVFVRAQILDFVFHDGRFTRPAHAMDEYHVFEPLIDLGVLDEAHERRGASPGAEQVQPLARLEVMQQQRAGGLAADQDLIALLDVLQARGQRAVGYLDAEELEVLLVVCTGNAIGAQQRPFVDLEADHDKLAILEAKRRITRGGEGELSICPVVYFEYPLRTDGSQDRYL